MNEQPLYFRSIEDLSELIRTRALSPVELTEAFITRIEECNPALQAYITVTPERARDDARRAEAEITRGAWRGPLHGIPVSLKDVFETAGVRTTAGSRLLLDHVPAEDSDVAARLRAAGTVLLGKTMAYEFALGTPYEDDFFPPARNPWDRDRIPGGSSSGSAAALSAGLCAGSVGSDTGGSIRHPAAHSGVVGLKPTYDLVSRAGTIPLAWSLDHAGPMTRSVGDAALLLEILVADGPEGARASYVSGLDAPIRGTRIGIPEEFLAANPVSEDVLRAFHSALDVLRSLGAATSPVALPWAEHAEAMLLVIQRAEAAAYHEPWVQEEDRRAEYGRGFWERLLPGYTFSATEYLQAQRGRGRLRRNLEQVLDEVDVVASPTMPRTAPTFAEQAALGVAMNVPFISLFNLTGQPSLSIPCGFDHQGLPIGLLLSGRAFDEQLLLRVGAAFQGATDWHLRRPPDPVANGGPARDARVAGAAGGRATWL